MTTPTQPTQPAQSVTLKINNARMGSKDSNGEKRK
jgi:hypothetical protein